MKDLPRDISIEYAHIYTNNNIGLEHEVSITILEKLKKKFDLEKKSYSLVVMVDDYSFPDPTFDYESFIKWLSENGFEPDVSFRESQLIPLCDDVLRSITNKKLHKQLVDYIKTKKYPCSLFVAAWYLLRLGYLKYPTFNEKFCAKKLLNILPESFKPFEDMALEIIASSEFSGAEKLIEYSFIDGRLLA